MKEKIYIIYIYDTEKDLLENFRLDLIKKRYDFMSCTNVETYETMYRFVMKVRCRLKLSAKICSWLYKSIFSAYKKHYKISKD